MALTQQANKKKHNANLQEVVILYSGLKNVIFLCNFTKAKVINNKIITARREHTIKQSLTVDDILLRLLPNIIIFIILMFVYYQIKVFDIGTLLFFIALASRKEFFVGLAFFFPSLYSLFTIIHYHLTSCISCILDTFAYSYEYMLASTITSYFLYIIYIFLIKPVVITEENIIMAILE